MAIKLSSIDQIDTGIITLSSSCFTVASHCSDLNGVKTLCATAPIIL